MLENDHQQCGSRNLGNDFWNQLNSAYNASDSMGDFQADYYWPTKDTKLDLTELVVEIVGGKVYTQGDTPRIHFHLRLTSLNKKGIKSCRLAPESMRYLRMDMERLGIRVNDIRKLGEEVKSIFNKPIQAKLYLNTKTGWQDMDFMGFATSNDDLAKEFCETPAQNQPTNYDMDLFN